MIMAGIARVNIQQQLSHHGARSREAEQTSPRPARVRFFVPTQGVGTFALTGRKAINFGAFLLEEPSFMWGVKAMQVLKAEELPLCTATVMNWVKNDNGLYTGAELGFRVDSTNSNIKLKFSLTFEAPTLRSTTTGEQSTNLVTASDGAQTTAFRR